MTSRTRPLLKSSDGLLAEPATPHTVLPRRTLLLETGTVLLASLGFSALWSIWALTEVMTRPDVKLGSMVTSINTNRTPDRLWLDFANQLLVNAQRVVPAMLVLYLLSRTWRRPARMLGLDFRRPWHDLAWAFVLAAVIGIPGLAIYRIGVALDITMNISPANLKDVWWAIPMYVLAALTNAVLEEVVGPGYLVTRWREAGWAAWVAVVLAAVVRGGYHLYQGFGQFVGNFLMGLIFGAYAVRKGRIMPLVLAHWLIDIVAFVGATYVMGKVSWL